jgi:hypothetical protein
MLCAIKEPRKIRFRVVFSLDPSVAHEPETITGLVNNLKVLRTKLLDHVMKSKNTPSLYSTYPAVGTVAFIPAVASSAPNEGLHDHVAIGGKVFLCLGIDVDEFDVFGDDLVGPLADVVGYPAERRYQATLSTIRSQPVRWGRCR